MKFTPDNFEQLLKEGETIIFIIDVDHINKGEYNGKTFGNVAGFEHLLTEKFKLFDDDGILYYEGRASNQSNESAFDPLEWAMGDSGCTEIQYLNNGRWETL